MDKKLKGYPPDYIDFNYYFYGCGDPDCPPISKELREQMWQPKLPVLGKVLITSAAGEKDNYFNKIWTESTE